MKLQSVLLLLLFVQTIFLFSSCNSMVGLGLSENRGNLLYEKNEAITKRARGAFVEYRWKKMIQRNWSSSNTRHGFGVDYNLSYRGYGSIYNEGSDILQSIQGKYYYNVSESSSSSKRIDLAFGIGLGQFPIPSRSKAFPLVTNLSADIYFPKVSFLYLTPKINYVHSLNDNTYNLSFEIGIGIPFEDL